jgi:hypothetical protein
LRKRGGMAAIVLGQVDWQPQARVVEQVHVHVDTLGS